MPQSRILTIVLLAVVGLAAQDRLPPEKLFREWPEVWSSFDIHPKDCHLGFRDERGRLITVGVETKGDPRTIAARQQITMLVNERGLWTDPIEVSRPGVVYFPALAVASDGSVWVAWAEFDGAEWHIRVRRWVDGRLGPAHRVSEGEVNLQPTIVAAKQGIAVAWQAAKDGRFEIQGSAYRDGTWTAPRTISRAGEHEFRPKAAADANGGIWLAWDRFEKGRYQVFARRLWEEPVAVFAGDRDTMYPQLVADGAGRVWVLASGRLAALDASGQRFELEAALPEWQGGPDFMNLDPEGRLWLFKGIGSRSAFDWMRGYRNAETAMAVADSRGLHALNTFDTYLGYASPQIDPNGVVWAMNRVQFLRYSTPASGLAGPPQVRAAPLTKPAVTPEPRREWPRYEVEISRQKNSTWWAEMHNHLRELPREAQIASWVDRFYLTSRYRTGLDAAAITDHDWPGMTRSMYFVEQAVARVLDSDGDFLAFTGYEWSGDSQVRGRFGDRTVLFPNGYHDIPRISDESANDAEKLSRQIARLGALDWPHHIGRQESPVPPESLNRATEPVMEMTSGHGVFETYNPADAVPVPFRTQIVQGTSVQDALAYGKRVGMVGSSDSHSGFVRPQSGMLAVVAPQLTREAMMKAILARRTYAIRGGEPILVDLRADGHFMGSEYTASGPVEIEVKVEGSKPVRRIELVRNNQYILTKDYEDNSSKRSLHYRDLETTPAYYYVRVWQSEGEWAWTSPIWADRE